LFQLSPIMNTKIGVCDTMSCMSMHILWWEKCCNDSFLHILQVLVWKALYDHKMTSVNLFVLIPYRGPVFKNILTDKTFYKWGLTVGTWIVFIFISLTFFLKKRRYCYGHLSIVVALIFSFKWPWPSRLKYWILVKCHNFVIFALWWL
jgi:hypothetical protein